MKLIVHNNLREAQVIHATRLVVEDSLGNPIVVALEYAPDQIIAAHPGDKDFNNLLKNLGINKVVVCTDIEQKPLNEIIFDRG